MEGFMPSDQINLPAEAQELPEHAQNLFRAAFKSAHEDGMTEQGATEVAWNSVKKGYEKGPDGQWHIIPQETNVHNKSVVSGGN
jgi:cation transport regulator